MTNTLDFAIGKNFILKTKIMIGVFLVILLIQFIGFITAYSNHFVGEGILIKALLVPLFLLILITDQVFMLKYVKKKIAVNHGINKAIIYVASILEISFPSVVIAYGCVLVENDPNIRPYLILNSPPEFLYFIFLALSSLLLERKLCITMGVVAALQYLVLVIFFLKGHNEMEFTVSLFKPMVIVAAGIVIGFISSSIRNSVLAQLESQRVMIEELDSKVKERTHEINEQKEIIEEKNKEIVDSINYAKRIQDAYLPPSDVLKDYFPESFLLFKPKDIVSGDFYWFFAPVNEEGNTTQQVFVAVADCTGHGVPGAIMSVICCNALNEAVITRKIRDTGKILDVVRETIIRDLKSGKIGNQKDGMDITLVSVHRSSNLVEYSGANNPLWILKKDEKEITEVKPDKQPVGMFDKIIPFKVQQLSLEKGDRLFLFSDGFADQFGGEKGKKFKYANLQKLFIEKSTHQFTDLDTDLNDAFENWRGNLEQVDDVCIIGIKI